MVLSEVGEAEAASHISTHKPPLKVHHLPSV